MTFSRAAVVTFALLLTLAPLQAQTGGEAAAPPFPDGTPNWVVIAVTVLGGAGTVGFIARELVRHYMAKARAKDRSAYDARMKRLDADEADRERRFDLAMARLQGQQQGEAANAAQMTQLTESLNQLVTVMGAGAVTQAQERKDALTERGGFRSAVEGNTGELTKLIAVVSQVKTNSDKMLHLLEDMATRGVASQMMKEVAAHLAPQMERVAQAVGSAEAAVSAATADSDTQLPVIRPEMTGVKVDEPPLG